MVSNSEQRQTARDTVLVMAQLQVDGRDGEHLVRIRNLSPAGLMAEGNVQVVRGQAVWIALPDVGRVEGSVAWVQDNRFGVAFHHSADPSPAQATAPIAG